MGTRTSTAGPIPAFLHERTSSWPWIMTAGVLAVITGGIALVYPGITILALAPVLGIGLIVSGVVQISDAAAAPQGVRGRGWAVTLGIVSAIADAVCLFPPRGVLLLWSLVRRCGLPSLASMT